MIIEQIRSQPMSPALTRFLGVVFGSDTSHYVKILAPGLVLECEDDSKDGQVIGAAWHLEKELAEVVGRAGLSPSDAAAFRLTLGGLVHDGRPDRPEPVIPPLCRATAGLVKEVVQRLSLTEHMMFDLFIASALFVIKRTYARMDFADPDSVRAYGDVIREFNRDFGNILQQVGLS